MSEVINDLVFGKLTFNEDSQSWISTKYIEALSKEISINLILDDNEKNIPDKFKQIFLNLWDNYESLEPKLADEMLSFYHEDGIEWSANELSVSAIVDHLAKGLDPEMLDDESDLEPPEINTLKQIRETMTLEEIKISYLPEEYLTTNYEEEYQLKINYKVTWLSEMITMDLNPDTFEIYEVALARYIY